jgi:hypothetical protein
MRTNENDVQPQAVKFPLRKAMVQLLGFAIGIALLAWCIHAAIKGGGEGWQKIRSADTWLIAGLIGCTIVSLLCNGAMFWIVVRPLHPLRLVDMQLFNLAAGVLNYAPVRAGLLARIAYHVRVDRIGLLTIGGWFAAIGYTLVLTLSAIVLATVIRPTFDWIWALLIVAQLVVGGLITGSVMGLPIVQRIGRGMDRMLRERAALWGAIVLRLIDVAAYTGRMWCAARILEIQLSLSSVLLLSIAAIAVSMNPLGRIGFREAGVAFFAAYLGMSGEDFEAQRSQLALIESAGEAIITIPLGAIALLWYRKKWIRRGRDT